MRSCSLLLLALQAAGALQPALRPWVPQRISQRASTPLMNALEIENQELLAENKILREEVCARAVVALQRFARR